jgi:hypothetical protein
VTPGLRRLYAPQRASVRTDSGGTPLEVDGVYVHSIREEWVVEDRWWVPEKLRRRYLELAMADGRVVVVFHCAVTKRWYRQRA